MKVEFRGNRSPIAEEVIEDAVDNRTYGSRTREVLPKSAFPVRRLQPQHGISSMNPHAVSLKDAQIDAAFKEVELESRNISHAAEVVGLLENEWYLEAYPRRRMPELDNSLIAAGIIVRPHRGRAA